MKHLASSTRYQTDKHFGNHAPQSSISPLAPVFRWIKRVSAAAMVLTMLGSPAIAQDRTTPPAAEQGEAENFKLDWPDDAAFYYDHIKRNPAYANVGVHDLLTAASTDADANIKSGLYLLALEKAEKDLNTVKNIEKHIDTDFNMPDAVRIKLTIDHLSKEDVKGRIAELILAKQYTEAGDLALAIRNLTLRPNLNSLERESPLAYYNVGLFLLEADRDEAFDFIAKGPANMPLVKLANNLKSENVNDRINAADQIWDGRFPAPNADKEKLKARLIPVYVDLLPFLQGAKKLEVEQKIQAYKIPEVDNDFIGTWNWWDDTKLIIDNRGRFSINSTNEGFIKVWNTNSLTGHWEMQDEQLVLLANNNFKADRRSNIYLTLVGNNKLKVEGKVVPNRTITRHK